MLSLQAATLTKLEYSRRALLREFAHLPREQVVGQLETVTHRLVADARFEDYIPVLAHRFARERLRAHPAVRMYSQAA